MKFKTLALCVLTAFSFAPATFAADSMKPTKTIASVRTSSYSFRVYQTEEDAKKLAAHLCKVQIKSGDKTYTLTVHRTRTIQGIVQVLGNHTGDTQPLTLALKEKDGVTSCLPNQTVIDSLKDQRGSLPILHALAGAQDVIIQISKTNQLVMSNVPDEATVADLVANFMEARSCGPTTFAYIDDATRGLITLAEEAAIASIKRKDGSLPLLYPIAKDPATRVP